MSAILSDRIETPIGAMVLLARDGGLLLLEFEDAEDRVAREMKRRFGGADAQPTDNPFGLTERVQHYFAGDLAAIEGLATDCGGTLFEEGVWAELKTIPCGATQSYGAIARRLGDVGMSRAVGIAMRGTPLPSWCRATG